MGENLCSRSEEVAIQFEAWKIRQANPRMTKDEALQRARRIFEQLRFLSFLKFRENP